MEATLRSPQSARARVRGNPGFGHEEWLNRPEWTFNGWRYGYLEGLARSASLPGRHIRIILLAIKPTKERERVYVGEISSAEVLTEGGADAAHDFARKKGRLKAMISEVAESGGDAGTIQRALRHPRSFANMRFRPDALRLFDSPIPIPRSHFLYRFSRYLLTEAKGTAGLHYRHTKRRNAMTGRRSTTVQQRKGSDSSMADPIEARMQNELRDILEERFGAEAVVAEKDYIDLRVKTPRKNILIEIKSASSPRLAIRSALGQLLEYAFFRDRSPRVQLVIVGRGKLRRSERLSLATLSQRFKLPVIYQQYVPGSLAFSLE